MDELRLARPLAPEFDVRAAGLKPLGVAAGGDLTKRVLARQPDFDVVSLGRRKSHVTRAQQHRPMRQFETLEYFLGVARQRLELVIGLLGNRELHELDLVELVLPDESANVGAV